MLKYVMFVGCNIPARVSQYLDATLAVFGKLEIDLLQIPDFNCCGYPVRQFDQEAFVVSAARNLALAEKSGLDMMVLCKCCYGSLKTAQFILNNDADLKKKVQGILAKDGLSYAGRTRIKHLLGVLYDDVGIKTLEGYIQKRFQNLLIAASYGCHALRPSAVTRFDHPVSPVIFDKLVKLTGAKSVDWAKKTDCCGAPLMGINDGLSIQMMNRKIADAQKAGAEYICTSCPFCHMQFDLIQAQLLQDDKSRKPLAPILYPQLLGLSMGIDAQQLGVEKNQLDLSGINLFCLKG